MKAFKKLALVTAIAAAPFAQAEMTSIDDSVLGEMTGQAGISIELSAEVTIGAINYTDTDGDLDAAAPAAGTLGINNVALGGNGLDVNGDPILDVNGNQVVTGALAGIKIDIDVDANDGLVIHLGSTNEAGVLTGNLPVDFGLSVGDVTLNADPLVANSGATLASNIYIGGNLGPVDVVIANDSTIAVDAFFEVTHGSMDIDVMGMGISNLTIGQDSNPFMASAYGTTLNATIGAQTFTPAAASANPAIVAALDADASGDVSQAELDGAGITTVASADAALGQGGALIEGARVGNGYTGLDNMAYVGMTIATASTGYADALGQPTAISNALSISIDSMSMDIAMDVSLGGNGIGNVQIDDLDLSGTTLLIYGH
jgi:hypothetical protein